MQRNVDLSALARASDTIERPRRGWARVVLPVGIGAVFLFVLRDALVELVRPRIEVTVVRPTRIEGDGASGVAQLGSDVVAVQAAGWIEPDPFPQLVPALAGGVVSELLVLESDALEPGDAVARLVDEDARITRDIAAAALSVAEGELAAARARAAIADERFASALEVTAELDVARALNEGAVADAALRDAAVAEGDARVSLAQSEVVVQRELDAAGAAGPRQVEIAESELEVARATLSRLRAEAASSRAREGESVARLERARAEMELRFADRLERDVARAAHTSAESRVAEARAKLAEATLALERMTIRAPDAGVVLERLVTEGENLPPGAAVYSVWTPASLRVRVDVPQGDLESIFVGQRTEITSDARRGRPYGGEVVRVVQLADIQKVTLEVQVRVDGGDALLRPDMLVQVQFFGAQERSNGDSAASSSSVGGRIAVPSRVVFEGTVWVFDPVDRVARRTEVRLGATFGEPPMIEVLSGLDLTDKVIESGREALAAAGDLKAGVPVRIATNESRSTGESQ
jgi:HlyD family secretion protein